MASLADCIKQHTKKADREHVSSILKEKQQGHLDDKVEGKEARIAAVDDVLAELAQERAEIVAAIEANLGLSSDKSATPKEEVKNGERVYTPTEQEGQKTIGENDQKVPQEKQDNIIPESRIHLIKSSAFIGNDAKKADVLAAIEEARKQLPEPTPMIEGAEQIIWPKQITQKGKKIYQLAGGFDLAHGGLVNPQWQLYSGLGTLDVKPIGEAYYDLSDAKKYAEQYLLGNATPSGEPHIFKNAAKNYEIEIPNSKYHLDNFENVIKNSKGVKFSTTTKPTGTTLTELPADQRKTVDALIANGKLTELTNDQIEQTLLDAGVSPMQARYMVAFHGSPHDFENFSSDKIGTGEGAQAYGHGLYFASAREVAEFYKEKLSNHFAAKMNVIKQANIDGGVPDAIASRIVSNMTYEKVIPESAVKMVGYANRDYRPFITEHEKELIEAAIKAQDVQASGKLYEVELAPAQDEYLLWDRPLSEQSKKVKAALKMEMED